MHGLAPARSAEVAEPALVLNLKARGPPERPAEGLQVLLVQTAELVAAGVEAAFVLALVLAGPEGAVSTTVMVLIMSSLTTATPRRKKSAESEVITWSTGAQSRQHEPWPCAGV